MKKILASLFVLFLLSAKVSAQTEYQETIRQYVLEKLRFFYVDNPNTADPGNIGPMEVNKIAISEGRDIAGPLWNNANNEGLKTMLKKLLCATANGGNESFQRRIANVLLISDKKVLVFLYNDVPNGVPADTWKRSHPYCRSSNYGTAHNNASWPCASCYTNQTGEATGSIGIGSYFFSATRPNASGGWSTDDDKLHVFIHELVHTQLKLALESTLGNMSMYGTGGHSADELLPSKNSAFNEGIATSFAMRYHFPSGWNMTDWFNSNQSLKADNLTECPAGSTTEHCLQARLAAAAVAPVSFCRDSTTAKCYAIRDVPEQIIMHSENVTANIFYQYMDLFNSETMFVRSIKAAKTDMATAKFTYTPLFKEMIAASKRYVNAGAPAGATAKGHLLTMAIMDYHTGYRVDNLGALGRVLDIDYRTLPNNQQDYVDYFSMTGRQTLLRYRSSRTVWNVQDQLIRFAEYLNVRNPPAASGSGGH